MSWGLFLQIQEEIKVKMYEFYSNLGSNLFSSEAGGSPFHPKKQLVC